MHETPKSNFMFLQTLQIPHYYIGLKMDICLRALHTLILTFGLKKKKKKNPGLELTKIN